MLRNLDGLSLLSKDMPKKRLCVVFAHDEFVLEAVKEALDLNIIEPILIGDAKVIKTILIKLNVSFENIQIIDELNPEQATKIAMELVHQNQADIIMKGLIDTKFLLKGVVNNEYGIKSKPLLSHVGIISIPEYDRVLFASDGAMMIQPTFEEKIAIVDNAVELAHHLGYTLPKVGIVSSVEKVNPKIESTVHADMLKKHFENATDRIVDGPYAIDNLVSKESVIHKGIHSPVAGIADILIFPNLDAGNVFYKTAVFLAHGDSAGLVMGALVPIIVTSRSDTPKAKLNSILLAGVFHHGLFTSHN